MTVILIADPADPRLEPYRQLSEAELLGQRGLFVAEGRLVVERVLRDHRYRVESLLVNASSLQAIGPALACAGFDGVVYRIATRAFEAITGFNLHRGCLALVHRPALSSWQDAIGTSGLIVVLEGVTNADNVGSAFRNAAAFGAGAVLLSGTCCDPLYRKAIRTSMGSVLRVPFARLEPWPSAIGALRDAGFTVVALTPHQPSVPLDEFAATARSGRLALLVGTEGAGLSEEAESIAAVRVRIPMSSDVDSLNLAVATGIALWRLA